MSALIPSAPLFLALVAKSSLLFGLAWVAHLAMRRADPALRITLWRATSVALLVVPVLQIAGPRFRAPILPARISVLVNQITAPARPRGDSASAAASYKSPTRLRAVSLPELAMLIWFGGIVIGAVKISVSQWRLRRLLTRSRPAAERVVARADAIARRLGPNGSYDVLVVPGMGSPFITGLRKTVIGIPETDLADERQLDAVLAHELAHRRSGDHRWSALVALVRLAWWPHPSAWGIASAHRVACEEKADRSAAELDGDHEWYAALLARIALRAAPAPEPFVALSMLGESETFARLRLIASRARPEPRPRVARAVAVTVALAAAGLGCLSSSTRTRVDQNSVASPQRAMQADAALAERIAKPADAEDRTKALDELRGMLAANNSDSRLKAMATLSVLLDYDFDRSGFHDPLLACLSDKNPQVRSSALTTLSSSGSTLADLDAVIALADDPMPEVREAVAVGLFWTDKKNESPARDKTLLRLLDDDADKVVRGTLRASWGFPVGPEIEANMIELSRRRDLLDDAVYFALSTRPVMSLPIARRLIEVMEDINVDPYNTQARAVWGFASSEIAPDAREEVLDAMIRYYDARVGIGESKRDIIAGLGKDGSPKALDKLRAIANGDEADDLKMLARTVLSGR